MQSRSKKWSLWQGSRTTSGYWSVPRSGSAKRLTPQTILGHLPSKNGLTQMGHVSVGLSDLFGTLSSSSKKLSGQPLSSAGGSSALCRKTSIMFASRSLSPPPLPLSLSSAGRPRIISKAFASRRYAAAMFSGCGKACALVCACGSEVSTSSSVEKKVERSGRRGAGCAASSFAEMLCSTASSQLLCSCDFHTALLAFVARHVYSRVMCLAVIDARRRPRNGWSYRRYASSLVAFGISSGPRAGLAAPAQPQPQHSPHLPSSLVHTGSPMQMLDQHKLRGKSILRYAEKSSVRIAYHVAIDSDTWASARAP